ncbi:hypothetical protein I4U23_014685 [Adineta vaga]|nr:hypothetical protein I4U23_014685 [Adineta vaga]
MFKSYSLSNKFALLLFVLVFIASLRFSQATLIQNDDMVDSSNDEIQEQRRAYNLDKLRHFLLTSNSEQRAAKRDKQNFLKRKLIREYLQSVHGSDSGHFEDVKKRFTYCSLQDMLNGSLCRRRAIH